MKLIITCILSGAILAAPVQQLIGQDIQTESPMLPTDLKLTPAQRIQLNKEMTELLTEETYAAFARAEASRQLIQAATGINTYTTTSSGPPLPPPPTGGGTGQLVGSVPIDYVPAQPNVALVEIVAEVIVIGFLIYFAWYAYQNYLRLLDKIFNSQPPAPPPPQTNNPAMLPPGTRLGWDLGVSAPLNHPCIAIMDIRTNNWPDPYGGSGAIWTNVMQTTIQARESLTARWTNFVTLTVWESTARGRELLVRNGANQPIWTNYTIGNSQNPHGLFQPPLGISTAPAKFMRAAAVEP